MPIRMRPYQGEADKRRMAQLVRAYPAGNAHVVDLPYRLASWALEYPENVGLWEDGEGELVAWCVLQTPFWTVDYAFTPAALDLGIFPQILTWALSRGGQIAGQPNGHPHWFVAIFADRVEQIGDLERAGFERQDDWSQVYLTRSAGEPFPQPKLPDGFTICPLAGASEAGAYTDLHRAAFRSENMTAEWRACTLQAPEYRADLDLVAMAPDGRLAAFCVCWLGQDASGAPAGQVEPLGVHPDFQGRGLGRAILLAGLARLKDSGARTLIVETDDYRDAAYGLYTSAGFQVERKILMFGKAFA